MIFALMPAGFRLLPLIIIIDDARRCRFIHADAPPYTPASEILILSC